MLVLVPSYGVYLYVDQYVEYWCKSHAWCLSQKSMVHDPARDQNKDQGGWCWLWTAMDIPVTVSHDLHDLYKLHLQPMSLVWSGRPFITWSCSYQYVIVHTFVYSTFYSKGIESDFWLYDYQDCTAVIRSAKVTVRPGLRGLLLPWPSCKAKRKDLRIPSIIQYLVYQYHRWAIF